MDLQNQPTNQNMMTKYRTVNPMKPGDAEISIEEAAAVLSKVCRYAGHTPRLYSVAEHSLNCAHVAHTQNKLLPAQTLVVLCHDVAEVFVQDIIRPLKQYAPRELLEAEDKILNNFIARLPFCDLHRRQASSRHFMELVRIIDTRMASTEMSQFFGAEFEIDGYPPYPNFYLHATDFTPKQVEKAFIAYFESLVASCKGDFGE